MQHWQHRRLNLGVEVTVGVGLLLMIVGYAVWRYPGAISQGCRSHSFEGNLAFMRMLETSLHAAYLESGIDAPRDFVVYNTLEATSSHLLVVPVLALAAGAAGAWIAAFFPKSGYAKMRRSGQ